MMNLRSMACFLMFCEERGGARDGRGFRVGWRASGQGSGEGAAGEDLKLETTAMSARPYLAGMLGLQLQVKLHCVLLAAGCVQRLPQPEGKQGFSRPPGS